MLDNNVNCSCERLIACTTYKMEYYTIRNECVMKLIVPINRYCHEMYYALTTELHILA